MRLSVSDQDLSAVMSRFQPREGARMRLVVGSDGVDLVANAAGYLTLARWFMIMAHPMMEDHATPEWLNAAYHLGDVFASSCPETLATLEYENACPGEGVGPNGIRMYRSETVDRMQFG